MRGLATTAQKGVAYMCRHYTLFSRLQNGVSRLRRRFRRKAEVEREAILNNVAYDSATGRIKEAVFMNRLESGRYVCCVWEKTLKPFAVKMVKIRGVAGSGISGGMASVELENGIRFRGTEARTRHLYQDKARLAGALEAPTRANVLIFTKGYEAEKYLNEKGYKCLCEGVDFSLTEKTSVKGE